MAKGDLMSMILKDVKTAEKQLAKEVTPEINELFKDSVAKSLLAWYSDYTPRDYIRTNNFMDVYRTANTTVNNNVLTMTVDHSMMFDYPGWGKTSLSSDTAFDFMFMNGEHGHGHWMMYQSTPPFEVIDRDFQSGFGGRVQKIIDNKARKILFG